jgi:hypothetical protein
MFGHKHRQRITREDGYVRFSAGAVNPDRNEPGWQPGYNLVAVHVTGSGRDRKLKVDAHLRQWQSSPDQFRAVLTPQGESVFRHRIEFSGLERRDVGAAASAGGPPEITTGRDLKPAEPLAALQVWERDADREAAMGDAITRNLVFRFWNLTVSQRRDISLRLSLINKDELGLPEPERYGRALIRAFENGRLEELAREVAQKETRG